MRQRTAIVVTLCAAFIGAWAIGLYAQNRDRPRPVPAPSPPRSGSDLPCPEEPAQPTRLQIDVFELTCTGEQLAALDLDKIVADDAPPDVILKRLREVGSARLLVRTDDNVDLLQESSLTHGQRMPTVTDITVNKDGKTTPSVSYEDVGFIVNIKGRWREDDSPWADISCPMELSHVTNSSVEVSSGISLPAFTRFKVKKMVAVRNGKPVFTMSSSLPSPNDAQGTVNIALIRFQATRLAE